MFRRIVSLTSSITETLYALGAGDRVVGVTDACDYPAQVHSIPHVCSWFDPDMDRIVDLKPDLVLGLETAHLRFEREFETRGIRFVQFNPSSTADALEDMLRLGSLLGTDSRAGELVGGLRRRLAKLSEKVDTVSHNHRLSVSRVLEYTEGRLIVAGPRSFQYDVIKLAGGINVSASLDEAYPKVTRERFLQWDPDVVFICGSDDRHIAHLKKDPYWQSFKAIKQNRLYRFPCGLTCRTGPRIVDMAELLFTTLYGSSKL